jgi:hypothetical protein
MSEETPSLADRPLLDHLAGALEALLDYEPNPDLGECYFCDGELPAHDLYCPFTHARGALERYEQQGRLPL